MRLRRILMTVATTVLLWLAMVAAHLAAFAGYLKISHPDLILPEILGPMFLILFIVGPVIAVIYALVTPLTHGSQHWKIALRLIPLLCLVAILAWVLSNGGPFWWTVLPMVIGLTPPLLVAGAYSPTGAWRPWLIQLGCLCLSVLVAFGAGRLSHAALLPHDAALMVPDERLASYTDELPPCPDPTGAKEAVLATGLVTSVAISAPLPKRPDEVRLHRECEPPLLIGQRAGGEPIAFWLTFIAGGDKGRWVISGSTPLGGPRSREAALAAVTATSSSTVNKIELVGPLRPYWRVRAASVNYVYSLDRAVVEPDQPCYRLDDATRTQIHATLPTYEYRDCADDPAHPGRMLTEPKYDAWWYVWIEDGKVQGKEQRALVPTAKATWAAVKAAGYIPPPRRIGFGDAPPRPVGGPEDPAWEVEALALPGYQWVLVRHDWATGKVTRSGS